MILEPDADDDTLAAAMVATLLGAAAMRSPELLEAVRRRVTADPAPPP